VLDRMLDDYTLHIVGLFDCPDLDQLVSERVVRHGVVEDLAPLYDRCRVFIAPTRYAAGIPLKVIEAMGRGIPCVATPLLAEQLSATHEELPTGESPQHFAAQCARLYCDPEAWRTGSAAGRSLVERAYSHDAFDRVLAEVIDPVDRRHAAA
ncbi:MAG: glycosyltransferase, partial [Lysobacteraceae bacterium]